MALCGEGGMTSGDYFASGTSETKRSLVYLCHPHSLSVCSVDSMESVIDAQDQGDHPNSDCQPVRLIALSLCFAFRTRSIFTPIHDLVSFSHFDTGF